MDSPKPERVAMPGAPDAAGARDRNWWPAAVSAAIALAVFTVTLWGTFVYDDSLILTDPRYSSPARWLQFWTQQYWPTGIDNLYRPLTCMTFAIQIVLHGAVAWPYHLVNLLLHAGVAAAVAELGRRMIGNRASWVAGVLFAVHPIHVEAVSGIVGRLELLCTLPMIVAMCLFLKPMTTRRVWAIIGCFLVAVFAKEQGVLLPLMLLLLVPFRKQFLQIDSQTIAIEKKTLRWLGLTLCWLLAAYLIYRESILRFWWPRSLMYWTSNPMVRSDGVDRIVMPFVLLGRYLSLFVAPLHLSVDYGSMVIGWKVNYLQPHVYIGLTAAAIWLAAFAVSVIRRRWASFFLLLALALTYGLVSNAISLIGTIFAERLMYLPSVFLVLIVGSIVGRVRPSALAPIVALLVVLGAWRSFTYARLWNNPAALFMQTLDEQPRSLQLHDLARQQFMWESNYPAAREMGSRCVKDLPDIWDSYSLCADVDLQTRNYQHARQIIAEGAKRFPGAEAIAWRRKVDEAIASTQPTPAPTTQSLH